MPIYHTVDDAMSDVETRFLNNLPVSELQQADRLFFQIEQAWWFYEDFIVPDNPTVFRHYAKLRTFAKLLFEYSVLLRPLHNMFETLFEDYSAYRAQIPVFGCIILNKQMTKCVLCRTYNGNSWSFPRGKVNEGEDPFDCAIRETEEETGCNVVEFAKQDDNLTAYEGDNKLIIMYIVLGVDEDFPFAPLTRCEISEVAYHPLDDLPNTYGVLPFISRLKRWINRKKSQSISKQSSAKKERRSASVTTASTLRSTTAPHELSTTSGHSGRNKTSMAAQFDSRNNLTFETEQQEGVKRWSVDDMFAANSKLTGSLYEYDGNPHTFGSYHPRYVNYNKQEISDVKSNREVSTVPTSVTKRRLLLSTLCIGGVTSSTKAAPPTTSGAVVHAPTVGDTHTETLLLNSVFHQLNSIDIRQNAVLQILRPASTQSVSTPVDANKLKTCFIAPKLSLSL